MPPRVLLLQARHPGDPVRGEELRSFAAKMGLEAGRVTPHDLLAGPPEPADLRRHDAVAIGGSGEFLVSAGDLPQFPRQLETLAEMAHSGQPMFASCFGFQLLVEALGGEVVYDPESAEVGTYELELTEAGREDPLFGRLPPTFAAQLGRKDRATRLPAGTPCLATSARAPFQALALPGRPVWATQFHPELDEESNRGRYLRYLDGYARVLDPAEREAVLERFGPSPDAEALLRRFVALVLA